MVLLVLIALGQLTLLWLILEAVRDAATQADAQSLQRSVWDIERQTIHSMLRAESDAGNIIDGTAQEQP